MNHYLTRCLLLFANFCFDTITVEKQNESRYQTLELDYIQILDTGGKDRFGLSTKE